MQKEYTRPFFSVIIPTYNRKDFVLLAVDSILSQTFKDFEVIVVDDGSVDNTDKLIGKIKDPRVFYYYKENGERASARNFGVLHAKGKYITFLDSDDICYSNHLQEAYSFVISQKSPSIFHLGYEVKDMRGNVIKRINNRNGSLNQQLIYGNSLSCLGVFIQQYIFEQYIFNEDRILSGSEDYELWMRLASRFPINYSNKITAALIQHDNRSVQNFSEKRLINRISFLIGCLLNDTEFTSVYQRKIHIFLAHRYLYLSLHLIMGRYRKNGLRYWIIAIRKHPSALFSRKTIGVFKNVVTSYLA